MIHAATPGCGPSGCIMFRARVEVRARFRARLSTGVYGLGSDLRRDPHGDAEGAGAGGGRVRPDVVQRQHREPPPAGDAQVDAGAQLQALRTIQMFTCFVVTA